MIDFRVQRHPLGYLEAANKPDPDALRAYYAERYYQSEQGNYRASYSDLELRYIDNKVHQKAEMVRELCPSLPPGGRMLDVGCGEGFALAYFRKRGWQVGGLDYSAAGMSAMNPSCLDALQTGDLMSLLKARIDAGERYHLVWLTNVLEHVPDPPSLLHQLRRLIGENGVLVVTVPNDFSALQNHLIDHHFIDQPFWIALPDHLAYFDRESLMSVARASGWSCAAMLADFPIDWFLLHSGSNYVRDRSCGPEAHRARMECENLLGMQPVDKVNRFYSAMADVGMGRDITAFLVPAEKA